MLGAFKYLKTDRSQLCCTGLSLYGQLSAFREMVHWGGQRIFHFLRLVHSLMATSGLYLLESVVVTRFGIAPAVTVN